MPRPDVEEARDAVVERIEKTGLLVKVEPHRSARRSFLSLESCHPALSLKTMVRQDEPL